MQKVTVVTMFGTIELIPEDTTDDLSAVTLISDIDRDDSDMMNAIDVVESVIMGHYAAGVDVTDSKYIEGINAALEGIDNNH